MLALGSDQRQQHVVKHKVAEVFEGRDVHVREELPSRRGFVLDVVAEHYQLAVAVSAERDDEWFKIRRLDKALCISVKLSPFFLEDLDVDGLDGQISFGGLIGERVHNNCDEQVEEHLNTKDDETDKETISDSCVATFI